MKKFNRVLGTVAASAILATGGLLMAPSASAATQNLGPLTCDEGQYVYIFSTTTGSGVTNHFWDGGGSNSGSQNGGTFTLTSATGLRSVSSARVETQATFFGTPRLECHGIR